MLKVSVLIPAYNSEKYIGEAIQSILNQTFTDFELLVLDDGSADNTWLEMQKFEDNRIQLLKNEINQGISFSRNKLMDNAKGEYLAWLDADDIALPERLAIQTKFMDENPDVGVCGSWYESFGSGSSIVKIPTSHKEIQCRNLFHCNISQSTVICRKNILYKHHLKYDINQNIGPDYELYIQLSSFGLLINLPLVLIKVRLHSKSISAIRKELQINNALQVRKRLLRQLSIQATEEELTLHHQVVKSFENPITLQTLQAIDTWLSKIKKANDTIQIYPEPEFTKMLAEIWLKNIAGYSKFGIGFWRLFSQSILSPYSKEFSTWQKWKFFIKCLIKKQ